MLAARVDPGLTARAEQSHGTANSNLTPAAPERVAQNASAAEEDPQADVTVSIPPREIPASTAVRPARQPAQRTFSETSTILGEAPRRPAPPASTRPPIRRQEDRRRRARGTSESSQRPILTPSNTQPADSTLIAADDPADQTERARTWRHPTGGPVFTRFELPGRFATQFRSPNPTNYQNRDLPPFADNVGPVPVTHPQGYDVEQALPPPDHATRANDTQHPVGWAMGNLTWDDLTWSQKSQVLRLPWTSKGALKNHFVCGLGELVGTTLFLFFAFAGTEVANIQASNSGTDTTTGNNNGFNISVLFYISVAFGFSLIVNVWIFFRISGGLFNPAITFGMLLIKAISPIRATVLFIAQMAGGMLASVIVRFLFPENFNVRTTLGGGTSLAQGVFIEAVLTAELVFTVLMLAWEKHRATFIAPVGIGLALFIAEMAGVYFTGGSMNPSRSFGPCVVTANFDPEHWIYWVGPFTGSLIAVGFYKFIKLLEYEMVNPGADSDRREAAMSRIAAGSHGQDALPLSRADSAPSAMTQISSL